MTEQRQHPSDSELRERLSPEEYHVTRQCGTEPPFSGRYWDTKTEGSYSCVCCDAVLFRSETKFDSGSGWPSFWDVVDQAAVRLLVDDSHGMVRTEARCAACDAHLGHVFSDGPLPTGQRFCINSAALQLQADG